MKRKITSLFTFMLFSVSMSFGQIGSVATNFIVTDIDGNSHNLYQILNSGRVVILECATSWCSTCWSFHNGHYLQDLNDLYGPNGTDQARVIFYEVDPSTTLADLQGTGGNTMGNWLAGTDYPYVNESPVSLSGAKYWPLGFPTINVIAPQDKKIKADLFNVWGGGLPAMQSTVSQYFTNVGVEDLTVTTTSIAPNPTTGKLTVSIESSVSSDVNVELVDLLGKVVSTDVRTLSTGSNSINLDYTGLNTGQYILRISGDFGVSTSNIQIK